MHGLEGLLASSAGSSTGTTVPTGLVVLAVGLILCFFGVRSLRPTGFLVGFALAALLAAVLGANPLISLVVGVAGGIVGFALLIVVFRFSLWLIGGLVRYALLWALEAGETSFSIIGRGPQAYPMLPVCLLVQGRGWVVPASFQ